YPHGDPFYLGTFGIGGRVRVVEYMKNEDVDTILAFGTSFSEIGTDSWNSVLLSPKNRIQIDIDVDIFGRDNPRTVGVLGDAGYTAKILCEEIMKNKDQFKALNVENIVKGYKAMDNYRKMDVYTSETVPLAPQRMFKDINDAFADYKVNYFTDC